MQLSSEEAVHAGVITVSKHQTFDAVRVAVKLGIKHRADRAGLSITLLRMFERCAGARTGVLAVSMSELQHQLAARLLRGGESGLHAVGGANTAA